jgi:thymidine kinase
MLEVITGCMFSGKTEELIRRLRRCQIAGQGVIAFKSALDDRYSSNIATHPIEGVPNTLKAIPVSDMDQVHRALYREVRIGSLPVETSYTIGFDEVQFMVPEIIGFLEAEANRGVRVIVAGLDLDSDGKPFGPMAELLARADKVTKLTAVCVAPHSDREVCGKPATRSFRLPEQSTGEQVQVGAEGVYEARCRACWVRGRAGQ